MGLKRSKNIYYLLIAFAVGFILLLGSWWLYLIFKLSVKLSKMNLPSIDGNLINMVKWEGTTFVVLLCILTIVLVYLYIQDYKKAKTIQAFFASLTHELKTPLASMRLQAEVLEDKISAIDLSEQDRVKIDKYLKRLIQDNHRLEGQLDNHLQLSRLGQGANLNTREIALLDFVKHEYRFFEQDLKLEVNIDSDVTIIADDFALKTILHNIFKNSIEHSDNEEVSAIISYKKKYNLIDYQDNGKNFTGNLKQLAQLFYKHNSPNGSGLGLYIIKLLMIGMGGKLIISPEGPKHLQLKFKEKTNE